MKKLFLFCLFLAIISCTTRVFAIIRLPPIMSSNMVCSKFTGHVVGMVKSY
ncbi:MAG: hypothetical protein HC867_04405 [Bacteroidia bacterium]|nr:hypothetical protein [Bacteroidia bacterium]